MGIAQAVDRRPARHGRRRGTKKAETGKARTGVEDARGDASCGETRKKHRLPSLFGSNTK